MMRYSTQPTAKFKKDVKRLKKRGYDLSLLKGIVDKLANGETLPARNLDHPLKGDKKGRRDCHILNDWVLVYRLDTSASVLVLMETGAHSDIFG